jgi:hypothetical protein
VKTILKIVLALTEPIIELRRRFMFRLNKKVAALALVLTLGAAILIAPAPQINAADHGDAPIASNDQSTDIADVFAYLDPNDNSKLILAMTVRGFIASGENANFGIFDRFLRYHFDLETTGDFRPDLDINVTFSPPPTSGGPQTATVTLPFGQSFTAPTTRSSTAATAPAQVVTTDAASGVSFFGGLVDDPFFFDIPAFGRFVASVLAGTPDVSQFQRGRDSFAGYNVMGIALSIPISQLRLQRTQNNPGGNIIGVSGEVQRRETTMVTRAGVQSIGRFRQVERMGNPAINVALIPFARKDEYNISNQVDDARGVFANDIIATLTALGTNATNIGILANVAVLRGDYLRVDINTPNTGTGGGNNAGAGFPNGRRLGDDTIDTILFFVANQNTLGDNVNANDVPLGNSFPFFAPSQQPRAAGVVDDNTRN